MFFFKYLICTVADAVENENRGGILLSSENLVESLFQINILQRQHLIGAPLIIHLIRINYFIRCIGI